MEESVYNRERNANKALERRVKEFGCGNGFPHSRDVGSLDCCGGALVDACTAVDAFSCVDDSDVIAGDCTLGADVNTCSTCHTLGLFDCNHLNH